MSTEENYTDTNNDTYTTLSTNTVLDDNDFLQLTTNNMNRHNQTKKKIKQKFKLLPQEKLIQIKETLNKITKLISNKTSNIPTLKTQIEKLKTSIDNNNNNLFKNIKIKTQNSNNLHQVNTAQYLIDKLTNISKIIDTYKDKKQLKNDFSELKQILSNLELKTKTTKIGGSNNIKNHKKTYNKIKKK
jgi:hypothetical protein